VDVDRRSFLGTCGAGVLAGPGAWRSDAGGASMGPLAQTDAVATWRREFPALTQQINGHRLAYLDSAATTLRPRAVIDALSRFDEGDNANPAAALHTLARRAADHYRASRARVATFLNASSPAEVVFTKGTTEAINLVASTWGVANIGRGDEIVLTVAEHYSNLLPWRALANRVGARIVVVDVDDEGRLRPEQVERALTARTRLVAFSHVSNVLGLVNPAAEISRIARNRNVAVLVDAAQSAPHMRLDVQSLGCDFVACSGHKILGPMGTGVLWAKQATLDEMIPYQLGSNMAHEVDATAAQFEKGALKFQAGTPNVSGAVGLSAAVDVLDRFDLAAIRRHDAALVRHFRERIADVPAVRVLGTLADPESRLPVFSFAVPGIPVAAVVKALDDRGVAVRAGDMAALPLLERFGVAEAVRASCYLYTTFEEVDRLVDGLRALQPISR
jgi:cysteine desulfurase/selenocysteine lyase